MAITAAMVKELRETTGAGMMDAKKALTETDGNMDAAIDWLRTKGLAKAAKKADRVAAEGLVGVQVTDGRGVAVEINSRPERLDPPRTLLRQALEAGCEFMIDTDAHAPGQLDWQPYGCERAAECEVPVDKVVNTRSVDDLLAWRTRL